MGPAVNHDCQLLEEAFQKYGKLEFGPNSEYDLTKNPKRKDIQKLTNQLRSDLKEWKDKKLLVVYVFACHGIVEGGVQGVIINEYKKSSGYYDIWKVENYIRGKARDYPNSYHIAFFACCRETFDPFRHSGCLGGTKEEAAAQFKAIEEVQKKAQEAHQDQTSEI